MTQKSSSISAAVAGSVVPHIGPAHPHMGENGSLYVSEGEGTRRRGIGALLAFFMFFLMAGICKDAMCIGGEAVGWSWG